MSQYKSRKDFLSNNPDASAFASLADATKQQQRITESAVKLTKNQLKDKKVVIIGSGVGGLTTAYELLVQQSGAQVTVLEALNRTGGRCLSLRTGDIIVEDENSKLFDSKPGQPQVVRFKRPTGDAEPYLNAGPGRIPSSHKRLLSYLKTFSVDVEVYVMNSEANLVQKDKAFGGNPAVYRRLDHNTRGWLAQMVYENAEMLLQKPELFINQDERAERIEALRSLMVSFGELDKDGSYQVDAGEQGFENGKTRAGYTVLPGVAAGVVAEVLSLDNLLESKFWEGTKFFQAADFLWQPTLFQPVGGMDEVQHAFSQQVSALGGDIHLNSPVKTIDWDQSSQQFIIGVSQVGTTDLKEYRADYCICNAAMPFLKKMLTDKLQSVDIDSGLSCDFKNALHAVYEAQFGPESAPFDDNAYVSRFLACTSKVGWQAERCLWQGSPVCTSLNSNLKVAVNDIPDSEQGVVPIFGGISWTDSEIQQIWYPSTGYQDQKGVLTGAYNFDEVAYRWGKMDIDQRLDIARADAGKFSTKFSAGLEEGLAIAWQNMPHIKGGWAYWQSLGDDATEHFDVIAQGSAVFSSDNCGTVPNFFIVGDQISSLPGWQEGAIAAALNCISRIADPTVRIAKLACLPDTRLMVQGI